MGMTEKNVCVCVYAMTSPCGKRAHVCDTNMFLFQKGYHTPQKKSEKIPSQRPSRFGGRELLVFFQPASQRSAMHLRHATRVKLYM